MTSDNLTASNWKNIYDYSNACEYAAKKENELNNFEYTTKVYFKTEDETIFSCNFCVVENYKQYTIIYTLNYGYFVLETNNTTLIIE